MEYTDPAMAQPDDGEPFRADDLLEMAWVIIANAGWERQPQDWLVAARRWRAGYHTQLGINN